MDNFMLTLGWMGIYAPVALGAIGSILGCGRAGQAACGAMLDTEGRYGTFVGVSALPSSQIIYGIIVMFFLQNEATREGADAIEMSPDIAGGLFAVGVLCGLALMVSAMVQGKCCASAINASKNKAEIFGLSLAPVGIVEGFAVFAFVFALLTGVGHPG